MAGGKENDGSAPSGDSNWLDRPENVTKIYRGLIAICALLIVAGFFVGGHGELAILHFPAFYGIFGFIAFVFIVFAGIGLRKLVMRDEDYYDR